MKDHDAAELNQCKLMIAILWMMDIAFLHTLSFWIVLYHPNIKQLQKCQQLLDGMHWITYKNYGTKFGWQHFHRLTVGSIFKCNVNDYSKCIGQEHIINKS